MLDFVWSCDRLSLTYEMIKKQGQEMNDALEIWIINTLN